MDKKIKKRVRVCTIVLVSVALICTVHYLHNRFSYSKEQPYYPKICQAGSHLTIGIIRDSWVSEKRKIDSLLQKGQNKEKILKLKPGGYYDAVEAAQGIFFEIVVNSHYRLSEDFVPENLVKYKNTPHLMNSEMAENLAKMISDMKRVGLNVWVVSAYRTYERQKYLYGNKVSQLKKQYGSKKTQEEIEAQAATIVAIQGTSEHQLGLAVDLTKDSTLTEKFGVSAEGKWIAENCHNYGFIIRYPKGKEHLTGIIYEPWHIRYVGIDLAKAILESGKCLEEYFSAIIPDKKKK